MLLFPRLSPTPSTSKVATVTSDTPGLHSGISRWHNHQQCVLQGPPVHSSSHSFGINAQISVSSQDFSIYLIFFFPQKRHLCLVLVFITKGRLVLLQQVYYYRNSAKQSASSLQLSFSIHTTSSKVPTLLTEFLFSLFPILETVSRNKKHKISLYSWWIKKVSQLLEFLHLENFAYLFWDFCHILHATFGHLADAEVWQQ